MVLAAQDDVCRPEHLQPARRNPGHSESQRARQRVRPDSPGDRGVLETRLSVKQFDSTIYPSQGSGTDGPRAGLSTPGSYFNDQDRTSRRVEWLTTYALTPLGPAHTMKIGRPASPTRRSMASIKAVPSRSCVRTARLSQEIHLHRQRSPGSPPDRAPWLRTGFVGRLSPRLTAQFGASVRLRLVHRRRQRRARASFTATVTEDGRNRDARRRRRVSTTRFRFNVASFVQMQERATTSFESDGVTPAGPQVLMPERRRIAPPHAAQHQLEYRARPGVAQELLRSRRLPAAGPALRTGAESDCIGGRRLGAPAGHRRPIPLPRGTGHGPVPVSRRRPDRRLVHAFVGDWESERLQRYFGNIENPVIRPDARGPLPWECNRTAISSGAMSACHASSPCSRCSMSEPDSPCPSRRGPEFRRPAERGRPLSHVRVARFAGEQAVASVSSQRHGRREGVQHHRPFQPPPTSRAILRAPASAASPTVLAGAFRGKWVFEF